MLVKPHCHHIHRPDAHQLTMEIISQLEWDLLAARAGSEAGQTSRAQKLAAYLAEADFSTVLLSAEAKAIFQSTPGLLDGLLSAEIPSNGSSSSYPDPQVQLVVAIALLHAFAQANWTGPHFTFTLADHIPGAGEVGELDSRAVSLLTLQGEPAYHLATYPSILLLSTRLLAALANISSPPATLAWWLLRAHLIHLALLDEPVALPESTLASLRDLAERIPESEQDLRTSLHIELGKYYHALGNDKLANQEFLSAARASELQYELTGALGKKTKYQVHIHSQLVLLAESRKREGEEAEGGTASEVASGSNSTLPEALALNDDTLLEETEFTKTSTPSSSTSPLSHIDPANQPPLHPLDQTLLLGLCLNTHNSLPSSGLTSSQMMPFISRVVSHPRNWSIHTTALLLRSRLEADRSRTVERSTLQLAALIDQMPTSDSHPKERLAYFHQLPLPSKWEMERELANRYMTVGVTRSALEIFTRLEMWEDAVGCLQRMEREAEAERIVRDLLEGKKVESDVVTSLAKSSLTEERRVRMSKAREGKLWCLLGDITLGSDAAATDPRGTKEKAVVMYEKAWEVSEGTSSRSRRSLGSLLVSAGEYEKAIPVLQAAGAINPLYARVWFTLGVCFTRLERFAEARDAFRRQVSVDEEDGEGWNNLAAVYLRLQEDKRAGNGDEDEEEVGVSFGFFSVTWKEERGARQDSRITGQVAIVGRARDGGKAEEKTTTRYKGGKGLSQIKSSRRWS